MINAELLITENVRLVYYIVNKLCKSEFVRQNKEDLASEGMLGLIKAAKAFEPAMGIKFATFASRCINNQMLMYIRRNKKHEAVLSLYTSIGGDEEGREMLLMDAIAEQNSELDKMICAADAVRDVELLMPKLTDRERRIIDCLQAGMNQKRIAKEIGVAQSYASRLIRKIRNKHIKLVERFNCG